MARTPPHNHILHVVVRWLVTWLVTTIRRRVHVHHTSAPPLSRRALHLPGGSYVAARHIYGCYYCCACSSLRVQPRPRPSHQHQCPTLKADGDAHHLSAPLSRFRKTERYMAATTAAHAHHYVCSLFRAHIISISVRSYRRRAHVHYTPAPPLSRRALRPWRFLRGRAAHIWPPLLLRMLITTCAASSAPISSASVSAAHTADVRTFTTYLHLSRALGKLSARRP